MVVIDNRNIFVKQNFEQLLSIDQLFIYVYQINYFILDIKRSSRTFIISIYQQKKHNIIKLLLASGTKIYTNSNKLYKYLDINNQSKIYECIITLFSTSSNQNIIDYIKESVLLLSKKINIISLQNFDQFSLQMQKSRLSPVIAAQRISQLLQNVFDINNLNDYIYIYNLYGCALYLLSKKKIHINKQQILKHFGFNIYKKMKNQYVSQHLSISPENSRPISIHNKINLLTLSKSGNKRKCFIPSDNKMFLLFDYIASNISIICKLIQYNPGNQIYQKLYNLLKKNNEEVSLDKKKNVVLKTIYSSDLIKYKQIEFYNSVYKISQILYQQYRENGQIYSYISQKPIVLDGKYIKKNILLNRFIMNLETQINLFILFCLLVISNNNSYNVLLYIYDSFLMQFNKQSIVEDFNQLQPIITMFDQFKISISIGSDYKSIKKIEFN